MLELIQDGLWNRLWANVIQVLVEERNDAVQMRGLDYILLVEVFSEEVPESIGYGSGHANPSTTQK